MKRMKFNLPGRPEELVMCEGGVVIYNNRLLMYKDEDGTWYSVESTSVPPLDRDVLEETLKKLENPEK